MCNRPNHIVGFTYEAAHHCRGCTHKRFGEPNEHGFYNPPVKDFEGNEATPFYCWEETSAALPLEDGGSDVSCSTCLGVIDEHYEN